MMLADLLRSQGDYFHARRHLSACVAGDADDPALHHMLGYLHDEDEEGDRTRSCATSARRSACARLQRMPSRSG